MGLCSPNVLLGDEVWVLNGFLWPFILEYLDFSLEDLLRHSIRFAEPEIAFIVSRVSWISSFIHVVC